MRGGRRGAFSRAAVVGACAFAQARCNWVMLACRCAPFWLFASLVAQSPAESDAAGAPAWTDFRGPTRDGHVPAGARLPLRWSEDENIAWKTPIPGEGWSSPVIEGGRVWLTTPNDGGRELVAVALDLESGVVLHERVLFEVDQPQPKNDLNSYASPSAAVEDGRAYVHFGTYGTACLDGPSGEVVWTRTDLHCDHMQGPGSSPILWQDLVIVHMDGGDVQFVIALDKGTGETRWRTDRSPTLAELDPDLRKAYSTPILIERDGRELLVSTGARETTFYRPDSGAVEYVVEHGGFSQSSRPVEGGGLVFLNTGYNRAQLVAVRATAAAGEIVWRNRRGVPTIPSVLYVDGQVYMIQNEGHLSVLDAKTGERQWFQRLAAAHCASPIYAPDGEGGRIYAFDREGGAVVFRPGDAFERLAENRLDEGCMASPAVVGDALIVRTRQAVYRIEASDD